MKRSNKVSNPPVPDDSTAILSGQATLPEWRRIQLERQLPQPRFPAGIGVPSMIMLFCLVVLGAITSVYSAMPVSRTVPHAITESQKDLVTDVAHRLSVGGQRDQADVAAFAAGYTPGPVPTAAFVSGATKTHPDWHSVAIWNPTTHVIIASSGETLPAAVLATDLSKAANVGFIGVDLRGRLVHLVRLPDGSVLGVSIAVGIRDLKLDPSASQSVLLVLDGTTLIYSQGHPVGDTDPVRGVVTRAVATHETHTSTGTSVIQNGVSRVPVVTASPVDGTGFAVTSITYVHRTGADASTAGEILGALLVLIGLLGFAFTRLAFVRPLRRLLDDAKAVACGDVGGAARTSRLREARRLGVALADLSAQKTAAHRRARRFGIGVTTAISVTSVLAIGWSVGLFAVVRYQVDLPDQVVTDYQNHADDAANALRDSLDTGLAALQGATTAHPDAVGDATATRHVLSGLLSANPRFRAAYAMRADGTLGARAGAKPMRHGYWDPHTPGLLVDTAETTVPLVIAHVPFGTGQLVVEFDERSLRSVLHRVRGDVHVVDADMRSVLDTGGFIAFHQENDAAVRSAATAAVHPTAAQPKPTDVRQRIVVASVVGGLPDTSVAPSAPPSSTAGPVAVTMPVAAATSPSAALGWIVVVTRDASDLDLPTTRQLHVAWLLMVLVITIAVIGWVWQYVMFSRPLRALVQATEGVAAGDHRTHITPVRFDEVGALAICLEVCRQAYAHGAERLAGAPRLRGAGADYTLVIPKIGADARSGGPKSAKNKD